MPSGNCFFYLLLSLSNLQDVEADFFHYAEGNGTKESRDPLPRFVRMLTAFFDIRPESFDKEHKSMGVDTRGIKSACARLGVSYIMPLKGGASSMRDYDAWLRNKSKTVACVFHHEHVYLVRKESSTSLPLDF